MSTKGSRTEEKLWRSLENLEDDLWDPDFPQALVEEELRALGVDPKALAARGKSFVAARKEEHRLSWQPRARARRQELEARAKRAAVSFEGDRDALLARLDQLRQASSDLDSAITMAARKRRPEQSSIEELRGLLEDMEALRALEGKD